MRAIAVCLALGLMTSVSFANDNLNESDVDNNADAVENQSEIEVLGQIVAGSDHCNYDLDGGALHNHTSNLDFTAADQEVLVEAIQVKASEIEDMGSESLEAFCVETEELAAARQLNG